MQAMDRPHSLLSPIGYSNNICGYCHNKSGSFSYYANTTSLTPEFYEALLNRGWRRSGSLLYKPDQRTSCCPQYTIRLDSHIFHASKDQRQCLNRFNKHILGDVYTKEAARLYPRSRDQAKRRNTEFDLFERIHESEKEHLRTPPDPAHYLKNTLEPDNFTEEKYLLFENYQRNVHHEPPHKISKSGFKNFLCNSPLPRTTKTFDGHERRLGSYHQCYRIDGKLIAIGVIDLLPQCVSAVYFMYHELVHEHGMGKLGALREIALAKEEGYKFWYAGFYIHSCVKMRYKGDYTPQQILDPESYHWDYLGDELKKKLDVKKYVSLSRERTEASSVYPIPLNESSEDLVDTTLANEGPETPVDPDPPLDDNPETEDFPSPEENFRLLTSSMPGIMTKAQLLTEIDLDHIKLRIRGTTAETCDLVTWSDINIDTPHSIKGIIADLVAAVGPELGREMVVCFD